MKLHGVIRSKEYAGGMQHTQIALNNSLLLNAVSQSDEAEALPVGSPVYVGWNISRSPMIPEEGLE